MCMPQEKDQNSTLAWNFYIRFPAHQTWINCTIPRTKSNPTKKMTQAPFCHVLAQMSLPWACNHSIAIESEEELLLVVSPATCMQCPNTSFCHQHYSTVHSIVLFSVTYHFPLYFFQQQVACIDLLTASSLRAHLLCGTIIIQWHNITFGLKHQTQTFHSR